VKDNSKKLLLWTYPIDGENKRKVPYSQLEWLLSDLTQSGRRSLVRLLEKKQLIFTDTITDQKRVSISSHGMNELEAQFPVLKRENDESVRPWSVVVFMDAPQQDPRFRYLRSKLVKHQLFSLKRGLYLYPGELPHDVKSTLEEVYRSSVVVLKVNEWSFGDEQIVIGQKTDLQDRLDVYSGISKEVDELIEAIHHNKSLSNKQKKQIYSIFDRLYQSLGTDLGLISRYYPQANSGVDLLNQIKSLINFS
jgi:DNA-binding transcriptional regulator PaaX